MKNVILNARSPSFGVLQAGMVAKALCKKKDGKNTVQEIESTKDPKDPFLEDPSSNFSESILTPE